MADNVLEPKVEELLNKLTESREKLEVYAGELEGLKNNVTSMFEREQTYRSKFVLDEKVRAMSEFYSSILRLRQEINKVLKDEISIRSNVKERRADSDDDIRDMARKVSEMTKDKNIEEIEQKIN